MSEKENKLIPSLRFPEFEKEGEWEDRKMSDLGETINGLTGKSGEDFGAGKPYVTYKQVFDNSIIDIKKCDKVQIDEDENQNSLQKGDVLFTTSSETPNEVGFASVLVNTPNEETYLNSFCFALRPFDIEQTYPQFSRYLFHSPIYRNSVTAIAQGSTRYNLSKKAFLELKVPVPSIQEQQKIAACLSSLDELIEAQSQKLELLKDHKKGLMQNLFPQEGEKVPKLRFKEFENDGEWVFKRFDEVFHFLITNSLSRDKLNYENGFVKNIHYGDVHTKFSTLFDITKEIVPFINSDVKIDRITEDNYCAEGDMVFADASEDLEDIGKSLEITNLNNEKLLAGLHTFLARQIESTLVIGFSGHLFKSNSIRNQIKRESQGAKVLGISKGRISNIKIYYPKSKSEQQKIASTLSSLDELITAQAEKIEQLKQHKKGLMQGLFPKMNG